MSGKIVYTLTAEDLVGAGRDWSAATLWSKKATMYLLAFWLILAGVMITFSQNDKLPITWPIALGVAAFMLIVLNAIALPLVILLNRWRMARHAKRTFAQQATLRGPVYVEWDDATLSLIGETGTTRLAWGDWHRWISGRHALLLLQSTHLYNILPNRTLSSEDRRDIESYLTTAAVTRLGRAHSTQSSPRSR